MACWKKYLSQTVGGFLFQVNQLSALLINNQNKKSQSGRTGNFKRLTKSISVTNIPSEDQHTYNLEKIRLEALAAINLMPEFLNALKPRAVKAYASGKDGFWVTLDEFECANVSCTNTMEALMVCFKIIIDSSKHDKFQNRILEAHLSKYIERELLETNRKSA